MTRLVAAALLLLASAAPAAAQSYFDQIGYPALTARLTAAGQAVPTGVGVPLGIMEAPVSFTPLTYAPDPGLAAGRPEFSITFMTTPAPPPYSGHANYVGGFLFANGTLARGVTSVQAWEANDWVARGLGFEGGALPGLTNLPKVSNHSYIAILGPDFTPAQAAELNVRADYLIDRGGHVMVVGTGNNGRTNPTEPAPSFGSFYNGIAVGRSDGSHQSGFTTVGNMGATGRVKPDLVAPVNTVSGATPVVSAAAAVLAQVGSTGPLAGDAGARTPQTIKAVLMAGATKAEFPTWTRTTAVPLDPQFGAGELNIDNSHLILSAGRQPATAGGAAAPVGWDFAGLASSGSTTRRYAFNVPAGTVRSLSGVLAWNREFETGSLTPTLADFDLFVYRSDAAFALVGDPLTASASRVDNVEHVWLTTLDPGWYALEVRLIGSGDADYALAWQTDFTPVPEPAGLFAVAVVGLVFVRRRR